MNPMQNPIFNIDDSSANMWMKPDLKEGDFEI
jgi:hypothetical protein